MDAQDFKSGDTDYKAIILPFQSRWKAGVSDGTIKAVFRKKGPSPKSNPEWIYAYFGSPISAVCAKLKIARILHLPISDAEQFCDLGGLSEADLRKYAGTSKEICVFELGECFIPNNSLGMDELSRLFGFQPTPSFIALSEEGWNQLDRALGFSAKVTSDGKKAK